MSNVPVVDDLLGDFGMDSSAAMPVAQADASHVSPYNAGTGGVDDLLGGLSIGGPTAADPFGMGAPTSGGAPVSAVTSAKPLPDLLS